MNKAESLYLKGWAILFMLILHYFSSDLISCTSLEGSIWVKWSDATQICVPIFLFLGGYGMTIVHLKKNNLNSKNISIRTFNLYKRYWFYIFPFLLSAYIFGPAFGRYMEWSAKELFLNLSGLRTWFDGPAWFLIIYIICISTLPLIFKIYPSKLSHSVVFTAGVLILSKFIFFIPWVRNDAGILSHIVKMFTIDYPMFVVGILYARFDLFSYIKNLFKQTSINKFFIVSISILIILFTLFSRVYLPMVSFTELLFVPLLCLGLMLMHPIKLIFNKLGKHSTSMWLTHIFVIGAFFGETLYAIKPWPISLLLFVVISYLLGWFLDKCFFFITSKRNKLTIN